MYTTDKRKSFFLYTTDKMKAFIKKTKHRACSTKMPHSQSFKRRCATCQHSPDNQTLRLQAGAREDYIINLPSGLDHADCEREEEEDLFVLTRMTRLKDFCLHN